MAVDFNKPAHVLVVHGVQVGEDEGIQCDRQIRALIAGSLAANHIDRDFVVRSYLYENINDRAQAFHQALARAVTSGKPLAGRSLELVIDAVGDVVTAATNASTAGVIRQGLREELLKSYRAHHQLIVVAHSLGTIYALDVINELIQSPHYFKGDDRTSWPVQGYISMGSPLGLGLQFAGIQVFDKRQIHTLADARHSLFAWHNYYNPLDPIVSGSLFGKPVQSQGARGPVETRYGPSVQQASWLLRGHVVTSGDIWLLAHIAYWNDPSIGDRIVDMLWG
ncbi:hypothetical protein GCM10007160_15730 [Litchfieldella qijiaojingensis]|uniref:Alpha/beta hydrolase n=1 Tax=Litchfieldella qijiaojingensis TaxID=980347 RepID=A0ABQ2YMP3_9GAMM|nr:hypothetical protein [Halomonas qijiaojingensis]GGX89225.1 hypothetical protein GCM10007160_15730 [Halomonas qijiaojingensis]